MKRDVTRAKMSIHHECQYPAVRPLAGAWTELRARGVPVGLWCLVKYIHGLLIMCSRVLADFLTFFSIYSGPHFSLSFTLSHNFTIFQHRRSQRGRGGRHLPTNLLTPHRAESCYFHVFFAHSWFILPRDVSASPLATRLSLTLIFNFLYFFHPLPHRFPHTSPHSFPHMPILTHILLLYPAFSSTHLATPPVLPHLLAPELPTSCLPSVNVTAYRYSDSDVITSPPQLKVNKHISILQHKTHNHWLYFYRFI